MHEMSIAASMLEAVTTESARRGAHVLAVGVEIGELSGVDSESLRFCFEALVQETDLAPLTLDIQLLPWRNRCRQCAHEFAVVEYHTECPQCGAPKRRWLAAASSSSPTWRSKRHDRHPPAAAPVIET
jgi:hydrogenase nickel incorporation protein HypA/HybF